MSLIQFTRNHNDHSTDKGYQFEFFCDRCHNGFMSEFRAFRHGHGVQRGAHAGQHLWRRAGQRGRLGLRDRTRGAGAGTRQGVSRGHRGSQTEFPPVSQMHAAGSAQATCWNAKRMLCFECAPDVETEMASAQVQAQVEQMKQKVRQQDLH